MTLDKYDCTAFLEVYYEKHKQCPDYFKSKTYTRFVSQFCATNTNTILTSEISIGLLNLFMIFILVKLMILCKKKLAMITKFD